MMDGYVKAYGGFTRNAWLPWLVGCRVLCVVSGWLDYPSRRIAAEMTEGDKLLAILFL